MRSLELLAGVLVMRCLIVIVGLCGRSDKRS